MPGHQRQTNDKARRFAGHQGPAIRRASARPGDGLPQLAVLAGEKQPGARSTGRSKRLCIGHPHTRTHTRTALTSSAFVAQAESHPSQSAAPGLKKVWFG